MRFYTNEANLKRRAKRVKKALKQHGHVLPHTRCLDLMARLYGFAHFVEMKRSVENGPLSPFDEDVDDATLEARFQQQERVMADAGFGDVAGVVLDEVNPTGRSNRSSAHDEDADHLSMEGA